MCSGLIFGLVTTGRRGGAFELLEVPYRPASLVTERIHSAFFRDQRTVVRSWLLGPLVRTPLIAVGTPPPRFYIQLLAEMVRRSVEDPFFTVSPHREFLSRRLAGSVEAGFRFAGRYGFRFLSFVDLNKLKRPVVCLFAILAA